jgi:hypothetical protein
MTKTTEPPKPPAHFDAAMQAWWSHYVSEFTLDPSERQVLEAMGDCWREYIGLRTALAAVGSYTFLDRFAAPRERPELGAMNRCRITYARLRRELRLPIEEPEDSRLPRTNGAHA